MSKILHTTAANRHIISVKNTTLINNGSNWAAAKKTVSTKTAKPTILPIIFLFGEYKRLTQGVAMWDVAAQRQVEIVGTDAAALTQYLTTRDISTTKIGQGRYVPFCNYEGHLINDPVLLKLSEDRFWVSIADSDIEMWAKAQGGAGTERPLFQKENVIGQDRIWASIAGANNTLWFSTEGGNLGAKSVNGGDLSLDAWYHLVSIYEAGKALKCYVNTVESTGATADTIGDGTAEDFYIGNVWAKNLAWDGLIPEVRIYNRALTPLEIQHNYLATKWRYR